MRKINTILVLLIIVLLLDHVIFGGLHMLGTGINVIRPLALTMLGLVILHAIISLIVTFRAEKAGFQTNARYNKENREFWNRRVSGVCILVLGILHAYLMAKNEEGIPRIAFMPRFFELATPLLVWFVYVHIKTNVRPLLISMGVRNIDKKEKIIKLILTLIMLFAMVTVVYTVASYIGGAR